MSYTRLKKNQSVRFTNGKSLRIIAKLGEGGQGIVYKAIDEKTGKEFAVKHIFPGVYKDIRATHKSISDNMESDSPSPVFTWPLAVTEVDDDTFIYAMKLIPKEYKPLTNFLLTNVRFKDMTAMVNATINVVEAFKRLHNAGYSYQDLNEENLFINPENGDIMICDTENIMGQGHFSGVLGKARYMAPEVVRQETMPNKETDRFSIALLLFLILIGDHPLEGARTNIPCLTTKYDSRFFGFRPLFIFDKNDKSNMPRQGLHDNAIMFWPLYPEYIRDAFERSFSQDSLLKAEGRLPEQEWIHLLMRLKSSIVKCPRCGSEMLIDCHNGSFCSDCGIQIIAPAYLKFDSRFNLPIEVPVYEGVKLFDYHFSKSSTDYSTVKAKVLSKPGKFGLMNYSGSNWQVISADGKSTSTKRDGQAALLGEGFKIEFSNENIAEVIIN